jgi:hypothetical protein
MVSALQDGDILYCHHSGTGEQGMSLLRDGKLVVALGAIIGLPLGTGISVREGPQQVRISVGWTKLRLREGEDAVVGPYYAYVGRTFREGFPGADSIAGIARLSDRLTKNTVVQPVAREVAGSFWQ